MKNPLVTRKEKSRGSSKGRRKIQKPPDPGRHPAPPPPPLQGKAPKEIHAILTETLAFFLPGRAKDLSAHLYIPVNNRFLMHSNK